MTSAAVNIHVQASVWTYIVSFLRYVPRCGIAESHDNSTLDLPRSCRTVFHRMAPFYMQKSSVWRFQFLHSFDDTCCYLLIFIIVTLKVRSGILLWLNLSFNHGNSCPLPLFFVVNYEFDKWETVCDPTSPTPCMGNWPGDLLLMQILQWVVSGSQGDGVLILVLPLIS